MKAHIERNVLGQNVKVYLYEESPSGRVFYWPLEYEEFGWSWYRCQEENGRLSDSLRPAIEMTLQMWDAFTKAILASEHVRTDALDIIAKTLEREQDRVDKLIGILTMPVMVQEKPR
jgi:hypothetical protein